MQTAIVLPWAGDSRQPWLALVTGADPVYGISREFMQPTSAVAGTGSVFIPSGSTGLYEGAWFDFQNNETRMFIAVQDGILRLLNWAEWTVAIRQILTQAGFFQSADATATFWVAESKGIGITSVVYVGPRPYSVLAILARRAGWSLVVAAPQQPTPTNLSVPHADVRHN